MADITAPTQRSTELARTCIKPLARGVCGAPVPADAPMPLCMADLAAAWDYCRDKIYHEQNERDADFQAAREKRVNDLFIQSREARETARRETAARLASPDVDDPESVVYYIRFGDRIKIGYSRNLASRLRALPHDELLTVEPGAIGVEKRRHLQFADLWIIGEWFRADPELLAHIEQLKAMHAREHDWLNYAKEAFGLVMPARMTEHEAIESLNGG